MRVLIAENNADLGLFWGRFLERKGCKVTLATTQKEAIAAMRFEDFDALVIDLVLPDGGAIALSDYATYRFPDIAIITVTSSNFFSDGSLFEIMPNARGVMRAPFRPDDLAALLDHCVTQTESQVSAEASSA